ncbi:MAG: right-handed parallel beta-helix repeat-containing protein, partial [Candidatus Woesearchaeota archaeon]
DGTHYLNTSLNLNNKYFDNAVVITGLNQGKPILKANIQKFEFPNNVWQNVSFNNLNLWASDYDTTDTIFIAYYENRTNLFSYNKYEDLLNSSKPEGIYYNISNKKILIRFKDLTKNPNQISLIISHRIPFYFTNVKGNGFVISGLNIEGAVRCAYIYGSDNILIENNTCVNGLKGFDVRGTSNITISNNLIYMKPGDFTWKDMKLSLMETSAIYMEDNLEDVNATFNEIYGYFNGILTYSKALDKFFNIDVSYNTIYDIYDDAIEIEDFCNKGSYHHNNISDVFVGFSLSPARALQNKCYIYNNLIIPDKNLKWDNKGNYYYGECYKIVDDLPAGYMDYHHNTCIGRGIYTTTTKTRTQVNSTWKNNIFFSNNQKLIEKSGLSIDGVFFDYNLYYRKDGNSIFKYWNSDTSTIEFSSLTSAKNSNQWDGKWDLNSLQTNPLFIDEANYDFRLRENSPACFMSDTNSYVGAFPCLNQNNNQNSQNNQENNSQEINNINLEQPLIVNFPPTQTKPILYSKNYQNSTDENLICLNQSTFDYNNDTVINKIKWFKNNNELIELENQTEISFANTKVNDVFECEITPYDSKEYGQKLKSNKLIILEKPVCGDNICSVNENCLSCSNDCGLCNITSCNLDNFILNEDEPLLNAINLNDCFSDVLNQTLNFDVSGNNKLNVKINNGLVSLEPEKDWFGNEKIKFYAYDSLGRNSSTNLITINVIDMADCGNNICENSETCSTCAIDCGKCPSKSTQSKNSGTSSSSITGKITNNLVKINQNNNTINNNQKTKENLEDNKIKNITINENLKEKPETLNKDSVKTNIQYLNNSNQNINDDKNLNNISIEKPKKQNISHLLILEGIIIIIISMFLVKSNNKLKLNSEIKSLDNSERKNIVIKKANIPLLINNFVIYDLKELSEAIETIDEIHYTKIKPIIKKWLLEQLQEKDIYEKIDSLTKDFFIKYIEDLLKIKLKN